MRPPDPAHPVPPFVHLRLHTEYSLVDGIVRVPRLMRAVAGAGMAAVALTDHGNLFAMVKFHREAEKRGVKPVIGADLWLSEEDERAEPARLTLLAQDETGFRNLTRLVSRSYLEGQARGRPLLARAWLDAGSTAGLIALVGRRRRRCRPRARGRPHGGGAGAARRLARAVRRPLLPRGAAHGAAPARRTTSPRCSRSSRSAPCPWSPRMTSVSSSATSSRRTRRVSASTRDSAWTIPAVPRRHSPEQYLKTPAEMAELFADLPEAIANSVEIARRCSLPLAHGGIFMPAFEVPDGTTAPQYLRRLAEEGLATRLAGTGDAARYQARLDEEIAVICNMGFEGYFLVVADFIRWARSQDIPVGPGRGSGAGSLVAWALGITDLDPLQHDLLFERFLNPERVSMPDFDIDFCMSRRDRVIEYVADRYGRDRVSQIITFGSLAARAVVRDVGRVLGLPYGFVDSVAKLIPFELGITLADALEKEPELARRYGAEDEVRDLLDLAQRLEGLARNAGTHAGGVVIAPRPLTDFTALYCESAGASVVTQFDKDDVEQVGLVKFDFLGLRTLTIIDWTVKLINAGRHERGEAPLDLARLPLDDADTYRLLKSCRTTAIFQLESRGMKDLVRKLQPDCFDDIVALVALFRPGPLQSGMVDDFIARKHGRNSGAIDYLHPSLAGILKPTYGVILYQEQVMQIAQTLSGYTLGGADLLRRAMGKKKPEEMATQRSVFVEGAVARGVPASRAGQIFDLIEKFAGYGFNKSHSAAYALLAYQTAWLKAHYPEAFMAAVLSSDMEHTDKVVSFIDECAGIGLEVMPPDVNHSMYAFTVAGPGTIRYGLGAIKGVGEGAVEAIVGERERHGPFRDLADLCRRVDLRVAGRRTLEAMVKSGCFDGFGKNRATLVNALPAAMQLGEQRTRAVAAGQDDLFGGLAGPARGTRALGDRPGRRAGLERGRAPAGRARDARPVPVGPSDRRVRGGIAAAGAGADRGPRRAAPDRGGPRFRRRQERDGRRARARDPAPRLAHDAPARRPQRTHRGQPVRRRLAAASRGDRARRDPGGRGPAAVRRVHRGLAHQREEADADRRAARARGAAPRDPAAGRRRRRPVAAAARGDAAGAARRPVRRRRALHRRRGARDAGARRGMGGEADPAAARRARPAGGPRRCPADVRPQAGMTPLY